MSRFENAFGGFGGGDSSSSEDEQNNSQSEEEQQQTNQKTTTSRYKAYEDSDDDAERTIKSGKTKRLEKLEKILEDSQKHANMEDFGKLLDDFEELSAELIKQEATMQEQYPSRLPSRVLKVLVLIEETLGEVSNAQAKKFNKPKNVAFTKLKQKFKKYKKPEEESALPDYLHKLEEQMEVYKKDPVDSDAEEEKEEEEEPKKAAKAAAVEEEEDDAEYDDEEEEDTKEEKKAAPAKPTDADDEYDEEYDEEGYYDEEDPDESDNEMKLDGEIDSKTRAKYAFLWKPEENWTPQEKRWKWVKKECLPPELLELMYG